MRKGKKKIIKDPFARARARAQTDVRRIYGTNLLLIAQPTIDQSTYPSVEGRGHRVVEEQVSTGAIDLEEDSSAATYSTAWPSTMETDIMDNEILIGTVDYKSTLEVTTAAISTNEVSIHYDTV